MNENTLWDEGSMRPDLPQIVFYEPSQEKLTECQILLTNERVADLQPKFQQIKELLLRYHPVMLSGGKEMPMPEYVESAVNKKGQNNKDALVDFLAFFLADIRNFGVYFASLEEDVQQVWHLIMGNYFASSHLLKHATGKTWMNEVPSRYYHYSRSLEVSDELPWFSILRSGISYDLQDNYLFIPRQYRSYLYPIFLAPRLNSLPPATDISPEKSLRTFNAEEKIFQLMPVMESLYKQNMLSIGKYTVTATTLKKAGKLLNADEFFPEDEDKTASQLRAFMLLSAYGISHSIVRDKESEPEVFIKKLVGAITRYPVILLALTLPHVSGIKLNMLGDSYASVQAAHIMKLLASGEPGQWMDIEYLRLRLYGMETGPCHNLLFSGDTLQKAEFVNTKNNKEHILLDDFYTEISVPFIKGFLFLLASFGIVEAAYGEHDPQSASYCCSLCYVRLTPLGEYVLGTRGTYTPATSNECLFEINADDLIVRSVGEANPYDALMPHISTPIGRGRYKITAGSFLNNCTTRKDIEEKISFFRKHICKQPPRNWEDFFNSLLQRCNPLQKVKSEDYKIYRLQADDKELQRIVSTDPYLRQYTKRAEDYLLLVESQHLREVISRLKSFGYLL